MALIAKSLLSGSVGQLLAPSAAALSKLGSMQIRHGSSHAENTNTFIKEALVHLDYPERLQKLLLTPEREMAVELAILKVSPDPAM